MRGKASLANRQHATALSPKSTPNSNTLLTTPRETAAAATAATHTHPSTPTQPRPAMEHDNSSNNNNQAPQQLVNEAVQLLMHQLEREQPCVATASITLGTLQDRLFSRNTTEPLQPTVAAYQQRFQELFVVPAAAKLAKCKTPQDKVVAIAKWLRGKLAKAPAHKQPLHTQYLPSALKDSGKRQLDCLGIATAVLAMCHHIALQSPAQHADLANTAMVVSDDHCLMVVGPDAGGPDAVFVEVTDPGVLAASQMQGWLYAAGHGMPCSAAQVLMVLVAGLMPEELNDDAAAEELRAVQLQLLTQLPEAHPEALFYSNFFRRGMLHEEDELEQLAAAAQTAADTGDMAGLQALALLPTSQLPSQQQYSVSLERSNGWMWHPGSCASFGFLNRMQAALCGDTDNLLCLSQLQGQQQDTIAPWLEVATFLLQEALVAVSSCTAVLRRYSGCAGKPNKAADSQLLEAVRDLWQNLADATRAVACLQQLQEQAQQQPQQQPQQQQHDDGTQLPPHRQHEQQEGQGQHAQQHPPPQQAPPAALENSSPGGHLGADMPAAAAVGGHTEHLAAALDKQAGGSGVLSTTTMKDALNNSAWLRTQLEFLDALLCFFGEDSADVPPAAVADFVTVAGTFTTSARVQAVADAVGQQSVHSSRVQGLLGSTVWEHLEPGLQQQLQMPGSRARKRQRKD